MANFFNRTLPKLVASICRALLLVFVSAVFSSSVLRYALDAGSVKLADIISYTFAALILLSVLVAFVTNKHVRVDMFSKLRTTFDKPLPSILSSLPFLAIAVLSLPAIGFSWSVLEGSREPDGLGGFFILKSLLPVSFGLIAIFLCFNRKDNQQ
jgi:TRAP-type mannitol/chloroaromatic compound transport system permease small subunit